MARCFRDLCREELEDGGGLGLAALWARTLPELLYTALKERSTMLNRNTYRSVGGVGLVTAFILLIPLRVSLRSPKNRSFSEIQDPI